MPRVTGPWSHAGIEEHLAASVIPLRLAINAGSWPVVVSLWYVYRDGALWCAMHEGARALRRLERDPRCGFEVARDAPPYHGVRGQARAALDRATGAAVLEALVDRYLGDRDSAFARWLLGRAAQEVAVRLTPRSFSSWDYRHRMPPGTPR